MPLPVGTLRSLQPTAVEGFLLFELEKRRNEELQSFIESISGPPVTAPTGENKYVDLGQTVGMHERTGPRKVQRLRDYEFFIRNKDYAATLLVYEWEKRRDQFGLVEQRIAQMRFHYEQHWAMLASDLLAAGTIAQCFDKTAFFGTSHVSGNSGTQSNLLPITGTTPDDLTVANLRKGIRAARQNWLGLKDDQGQIIKMPMQEVWVVVPPQYEDVANQAFNPRAADVAANVIAHQGTTYNVVVDPWRKSSSAGDPLYRSVELYLGGTRSIIRQTEVDLQITYKDDIHDNQREEYGINTVRGIGFGDWRGACKLTFAT